MSNKNYKKRLIVVSRTRLHFIERFYNKIKTMNKLIYSYKIHKKCAVLKKNTRTLQF